MMKNSIISSLLVAVVALLAAHHVTAFAVLPAARSRGGVVADSSLILFGMFGDAFKNDDALGKPKDAGLSNGPQYNEQVTVNGKAVQGAVVGQKLTVVAAKARVKIPVNCQQGDCGTCMVNFNGRKVKACQAVLPAGKAAIKTL